MVGRPNGLLDVVAPDIDSALFNIPGLVARGLEMAANLVPRPLDFEDLQLEMAIRHVLEKTEGPILPEDIAFLNVLNATRQKINSQRL